MAAVDAATSSALVVEVSPDAPKDRAAWDHLAESNGNLVQSTLFDPVQSFFRMRPLYLEARRGGALVGGVKVYGWQARRARIVTAGISRSTSQLGEFLVMPADGDSEGELLAVLQTALRRHLHEQGAVSFRSTGVYGGTSRLLVPGPPSRSLNTYRVAWVDLRPPLDAIWASFHDKHRAEIRKAERQEVGLVEDDDIEGFLELLAESYRDQSREGPNPAYVRHVYRTLRAAGRAHLFFAEHAGQRLAGAMIHRYGEIAFYDFAGLRRNRVGAGHLLQWRIMQTLRSSGTCRYALGQVSEPGGAAPDPRFEGISRFKRRFGGQEVPSQSSFYVLKPVRQALWSFVTRWMS